jgi:predicted DNA-binding WGR domain protein
VTKTNVPTTRLLQTTARRGIFARRHVRYIGNANQLWERATRRFTTCMEPTSFGEVMLVRNSGRVGTNGQVKFETFEAAEDAERR